MVWRGWADFWCTPLQVVVPFLPPNKTDIARLLWPDYQKLIVQHTTLASVLPCSGNNERQQLHDGRKKIEHSHIQRQQKGAGGNFISAFRDS